MLNRLNTMLMTHSIIEEQRRSDRRHHHHLESEAENLKEQEHEETLCKIYADENVYVVIKDTDTVQRP